MVFLYTAVESAPRRIANSARLRVVKVRLFAQRSQDCQCEHQHAVHNADLHPIQRLSERVRHEVWLARDVPQKAAQGDGRQKLNHVVAQLPKRPSQHDGAERFPQRRHERGNEPLLLLSHPRGVSAARRRRRRPPSTAESLQHRPLERLRVVLRHERARRLQQVIHLQLSPRALVRLDAASKKRRHPKKAHSRHRGRIRAPRDRRARRRRRRRRLGARARFFFHHHLASLARRARDDAAPRVDD